MRSHSMVRNFFLASALALAPAAALGEDFPNALAEKDGAVRLKPMAPWVLDFGDNRCRLARTFGSDKDKHMLMFEQGAPRNSFGMTMAGPELRRFHGTQSFSLGMAANAPMEEHELFASGDVDKVGRAIIIASHSLGPNRSAKGLLSAGINLDHAAAIDRIVLERRGRVLSFETGNMREPFEALNICTSDLLNDWGLDPERHKSYVPPRLTNEEAIKRRIGAAYPRQALQRGEQGIFRMRVIVEADGTVADCLIENATKTDQLDSPACQQMRKAQFEPARDSNGEPMRSFFATAISYKIN